MCLPFLLVIALLLALALSLQSQLAVLFCELSEKLGESNLLVTISTCFVGERWKRLVFTSPNYNSAL